MIRDNNITFKLNGPIVHFATRLQRSQFSHPNNRHRRLRLHYTFSRLHGRTNFLSNHTNQRLTIIQRRGYTLITRYTNGRVTFFVTSQRTQPTFRGHTVFMRQARIRIQGLRQRFRRQRHNSINQIHIGSTVRVQSHAMRPAIGAINQIQRTIAFRRLRIFVRRRRVTNNSFVGARTRLLDMVDTKLQTTNNSLPNRAQIITILRRGTTNRNRLLPINPHVVHRNILRLSRHLLSRLIFKWYWNLNRVNIL